MILVRARVKIFTESEGGSRQTGIATGYRPNHVFEYPQDGLWKTAFVGDLVLYDGDLYPGLQKDILVRFIKGQPIEKYIHIGRKWQFYEGPNHLIGEAEILEIISQ